VKTTAAFCTLIFYTLAMCKPLLPVIKDEIAHIFWKAHHIATVHHHDGEHHTEEEVATATHEDESDTHPSTTKLADPVSVHLAAQRDYDLLPPSITEQKFGAGIYKLSTLSLSKHYPPPKSC
jgi:hypothetical protein